MTTKAADVLQAALGHMQDRAATYDKPEGERSMPATVAAFNALTGHTLTAEQGWLFMTVLKLCRTQQGGHRPDNYEDGAAYFALMGEQAACDRAVPKTRYWIAIRDEKMREVVLRQQQERTKVRHDQWPHLEFTIGEIRKDDAELIPL